MKISVCIDAVLPGNDTAQKLRDLKRIGCQAFEFWSWWDKDLNVLKSAMEETGLALAAMCTRFISLTEPSKRGDYLRGLKESIGEAKKMGCRTLISQVGDDSGEDRAKQHQSVADGLKECVPLLRDAGIVLAVEPLNITIDHRGYYLWSSAEGFEIVREVDSPYVRLLYDIYHQQIMEGNILNTVTANLDLIGHMHAAGVPGRKELDRSELDYRYIFNTLDRAGYPGYMGFEYFPAEDSLAGIRKFL